MVSFWVQDILLFFVCGKARNWFKVGPTVVKPILFDAFQSVHLHLMLKQAQLLCSASRNHHRTAQTLHPTQPSMARLVRKERKTSA